MARGAILRTPVSLLFVVFSIAITEAEMWIEEPFELIEWPNWPFDYDEPVVEKFHCNDSRNTIIDKTWVCDQEADCLNGMDEHLSTCNKTTCFDEEFECKSFGICILDSWRCDGDNDCIDNEDEIGCVDDEEINGETVSCNNDTWRCSDNHQCIERYAVCDGVNDCIDGSDETKETCEERLECDGNYMPCYNPTLCIPNFWKCDGSNDCSDGSDETNCEVTVTANHTCFNGEVACNDIFKSAQCVPLSQQCDGVADCLNNEDEGAGCLILCQQIGGGTENTCSQKCNETPSGPVCSCSDGYRFSVDNKTCIDIDECSSPTVGCEQLCINTFGSYECQCTRGFALTSDKLRCKPHGHDPTYLFFGIRNEIRRITLLPFDEGRTNRTEQITHYDSLPGLNISSGATVVDVDYLYKSHTIFWLENQHDATAIKYKQGDGGVNNLIQSNNLLVFQRISIDWIGMNVFFTATDMTRLSQDHRCPNCGRVGMVSIKKLHERQSTRKSHGVAENLGNVMDIIVVATRGIVITCEYAIRGRILAVAMDGSDSRELKINVMRPNALSHDDTTNTLFWSQAPLSSWSNRDNDFQIRSMSLTSLEEKIILTRNHPYFKVAGSIAYFENRIRWYDIERHEIISADVPNGKHSTILTKFPPSNRTLGLAISLQISHLTLQQNIPGDNRWCEVLNCEYSCVLAASDLDVLDRNSSLVPQCLCPEKQYHFKLTSSCKVRGSIHFIILDNGYLRKVYDVGAQSSVEVQDSTSALAIVHDPNHDRIYYMDNDTNSIRYTITNGSNSRSATLVENVPPTRHFTIDPTTSMIYWIEECSIVAAMPLLGEQPPYIKATIFAHETSCPEGLAYDIHRSRLYFIIRTPESHLYSINAHGGDIRILRTVAELKTIRHMVFDPYSDSVVFIATPFLGEDYIVSLHLMSGKISEHDAFTNNPTTLAVTSTHLVVYDPRRGVLSTQQKTKNDEAHHSYILLEAWPKTDQFEGRGGMTYVDSNLNDFWNTSNPCSSSTSRKAPCSQFCFPTPVTAKNYTCGCPDGFRLKNDGYSCEVSGCGRNQLSCNHYNMTKDVKGRSRNDYPNCIDEIYICDRNVANCYDGSDESVELCGCTGSFLKECRIPGGDSSTNIQCLSFNLFCDGFVDCVNGADELDCTCNDTTEFQCSSPSICIPLDWVGDGFADCDDGGDEVGATVVCRSDEEFRCVSPVDCISQSFVCDGAEDCFDGSDEWDCSVYAIFENTTEFPTTVSSTQPTTSVSCELHHFKCADGGCLPDTTLVCNGNPDCPDSSDEGGNCSVPCGHFASSQRPWQNYCATDCYQSPNGPTCRCLEGYKYNYAKDRCEDINECLLKEDHCEHHCLNIDGSYICKCNEGYMLERGYNCKAKGIAPYYFISTESDFRIFTFRGHRYYEPVRLYFNNIETPREIRPSHFALRGILRFYWVDNESHRLYETRTWDGNTTLLTHSIPSISALCWDWGGEKLYWATAKSIEVVTETGQYSATIITSQNKINGLVINPVQSTLIYSTVSSNRKGSLILCSMDGDQCRVFAENDTDIFRSLTIDHIENTLYWVAHYSNRIEKTLLSSFARTTVYDDTRANVISGLSVFENKVSWIESDISRDEIDGNGDIPVSNHNNRSRMSMVFWRRENSVEVSSRLVFKQVPISTGLGVIQQWTQPPIEMDVCTVLSCHFFCWNQSFRPCTCPDKRLHSTAAYPLVRTNLCENLDVCPTPPLSEKGTKLNVKFVNGQPGGEADVNCPGEDEPHTLICKANGRWSRPLRCQNDYQTCQKLLIENGTVSIISNPNALTIQSSDSLWEDSIVSISCSEGFAFKSAAQNSTIKCGSDGQWLSSPPNCVEIKLARNKLKSSESSAEQSSWIVPVVVVAVIIVLIVVAIALWIGRKKGACFKIPKNRSSSSQLLSSARTNSLTDPYFDNSLAVSYTNNGDEYGFATIGMRGTNDVRAMSTEP